MVLEASPGASLFTINVPLITGGFSPTLDFLFVALILSEGVRRLGAVIKGPEDSVEGLILLSPKTRDCQYCPVLTQGQDNGAVTHPWWFAQDTTPPSSTDIPPTFWDCCTWEATLWKQST